MTGNSIRSKSSSVSRDKKRKRDKDRKKRDESSRSRSRDRKRHSSRKRSRESKVREKQKDKYRRKRDKSSSRHRKRHRSRSSSNYRKSRSNSKVSSENSIELRSRSTSRNKKYEREEKLRKERREKKYDNEVDKLKEKEIEKHKEFERKLNNENLKKSELNNSSNLNNIATANSKDKANANAKPISEEERQELVRKQRLAKARVFVLVEREEEKKNEEMLIENKGLIQDDFLEEKKKPANKFRFEDDFHFDEHDTENEDINANARTNILKNENIINKNLEKENFKIDDKSQETNKEDEMREINVTLGHRNMPHLPNGFFNNKSHKNNNQNQSHSHYASLQIKNLENEKKLAEEKIKNEEMKKAAALAASFSDNTSSKMEVEDEEDPLDKYMKEIQKSATLQDYQIYQEIFNQQLQKRYDDAVARDLNSEERIKKVNAQEDDNEEDEVKIIEDDKEMQIDVSKVITLDEIMKLNLENKSESENLEKQKECTGLVLFNRHEDDQDKSFIQALKTAPVPDIDPLYGYSNQKSSVVLYQEDYNEYLKEDNFNDVEEAWLKLKKSATEKKELKLVNHALINYESFRKNLYIECKEISNLDEQQIEAYRKNNGDIKVRGKNISNPILNWYQCGLSDRILLVLEKKGFPKPFPIQSQSIPCIMSGRDVIAIAETGSGKTLAYVLPLLRHVMDQRPLKVKLNIIFFFEFCNFSKIFSLFYLNFLGWRRTNRFDYGSNKRIGISNL